MSTQVDTKNETTKNDWEQDDEDDNWDDWGDADENFPDEVSIKNDASLKENSSEQMRSNKTENPDKPQTVRESARQTEAPQQIKSSWGMFGGVMSSVLSTAGNITTSVSQSLNQVIGVPDPEELARINAAQEEQEKEKRDAAIEDTETCVEQTTNAPVFGLSLVSGVTTLGSKVLNTGLDTLEGIGKKTMNILQENDPLLMNKRKMLGLEQEKPNLSEILKEAKKDADQMESTLKELRLEKSRELLRFETLFENNCGLVHMEALEILSKESALKLQTLLDSVSGNALRELKETIDEVRELLELEDLEGDSDGDYDARALDEKLLAAIEDADLQITFDEIVKNWTTALDWFEVSAPTASEEEIFAKGITTLAETCAYEMNKLHKIAELLLVKEHHSTANEVDCIVQLCKQFALHLNGLTNHFAALLKAKQTDLAKTHISTLFAEMVLATQHIEKAFKLFLPILQIGAV